MTYLECIQNVGRGDESHIRGQDVDYSLIITKEGL